MYTLYVWRWVQPHAIIICYDFAESEGMLCTVESNYGELQDGDGSELELEVGTSYSTFNLTPKAVC